MSKYLKTKEGSIESAVLKSVATPKEEPKVETKEYKTSSYFGTKEGSLGDVFNKVINEKVDNPYAVGMAQAMKSTGDKPPLKKSTITKAHDIAKSIKKDESIDENEYQKVFKKELEKSGKSLGSMSDSEKKDFFNKIDKMYKGKNEELTPAQKKLPPALQKAIAKKMKNKKEEVKEARWEIEGVISYRGISAEDDFHMVIDAPSESAAEAKAEKELEKARDRRKIGPGGGGNIEDFDIEHIQRTTDRLSAPQTTYRNSKEVEETHSYHKIKQNKKQTQADGEKEIIDPNPKLKAEDVIRGLWEKAADNKDDTSKQQLKVKLAKEKDTDALEKQLTAAQGQINVLKTKLENEKNKAIKPEPNPETGEVPLTVGVAYKHLRDKMKKEEKNPDVVSDDEKKEKKTKGKADTGSPKTPVDTEPQVDYKN